MTTRKRPATEELTSCSVPTLEPIQSSIPTDMNAARNILALAKTAATKVTAWLLGGFYQNPDPPTFGLSYGSTEILTETYIQTSEDRIDETTTLKRQRIRGARTTNTTTRARSADESFRRSGRGQMDLPAYNSRKALDEFFRPPEHGLLKRTKSSLLRPTLPSPTQSPSSEQNTSEKPFRRHSDSSETPLDPGSLPLTTQPFDLHTRTPLQPKLHTRKLQSRTPNSAQQPDLDNRLKNLLLDEREAVDAPSKLHVSSNKRAEIAERHRQRELKRAEELRQEEKRKADALKKLEKEKLERESQARLRRRLPNKPLVQSLDSKWEAQVNNAYHMNPINMVITTSIGGTELAVKDFRTLLAPQAWLNDEIINSYIEWVVDAANKVIPPNAAVGKEKPVPKLIAHNSFFWENLTKKGPSSTDRLMKRKGAGGKALLQVDTIFVPICKGAHWTIGTVRPVAKTIEYFDSFGGHGAPFIAQMRSWLKHQLGDAYVASEWKEPGTGCARQTNGYDCGVFVCTNAFCVAFGLETSCYMERDMELQRRRIAALLINRGFHGDFSWSSGGL